MFFKFFLFGAILNFHSDSSVLGAPKIAIDLNDANVTVDLQTYLDDLQVAASSAQYTVTLSARMVSKLQEQLANGRVSCTNDKRVEDVSGPVELNRVVPLNQKKNNAQLKHILSDSSGTWNEMRKYCLDRGYQLATLNGYYLQPSDLFATEGVFIGYHSLFAENEWTSIDGSPIPSHIHSSYRLMLNSNNESQCAVYHPLNNEIFSTNCSKLYYGLCERSFS